MASNDNLADLITQLCSEQFDKLGKNGKPNSKEWVVLSCFIKVSKLPGLEFQYEVVSLGTGTRCLGASQMSDKGHLIHDSHAEVIARRCFILYLLSEIEKCLEGSESIFLKSAETLCLKPLICFDFFSSELPCGDASIFPKEPEENFESSLKRQKVSAEPDCRSLGREIANDINRTGAKPASGEPKDPNCEGTEYHVLGVLRTKPGRGEKTLSHCCSDKIFKWSVLGVQGALVMLFLKHPIYIRNIVISKGLFNQESMERALCNRFRNDLDKIHIVKPFKHKSPTILNSKIVFPYCKSGERTNPCPISMIWSKTPPHEFKHEASTCGKKHGTSKKTYWVRRWLSHSRLNLMRKVILILNKVNLTYQTKENSQQKDKNSAEILFIDLAKLVFDNSSDFNLNSLTFIINTKDTSELKCPTMIYKNLKALSTNYQELWENMKGSFLQNWTKKSTSLKEFNLSVLKE